MVILLKIKKTLKDRKEVIRPKEIIPKEKCSMYFGIPQVNLIRDSQMGGYYLKEPSGIIRCGVTFEFYEKNEHLFKKYKF